MLKHLLELSHEGSPGGAPTRGALSCGPGEEHTWEELRLGERFHVDMAEEVAFSDRGALLTEDVVGGHDMKVKVGDGKLMQVVDPVDVEAAGKGEGDAASFEALEGVAVGEGLDVSDGLIDALLELFDARLVVLVARDVIESVGEPCHAEFCSV